MTRKILFAYYAATALFMSLDYGFDINVRAAFLEQTPSLRIGYYAVLVACFVLMLWRPNWTIIIGTFESLATLVALIFNMALRTMIVTDEMMQTGTGFVTPSEVVNFMIAGGAAYISWVRGLNALRPGSGGHL